MKLQCRRCKKLFNDVKSGADSISSHIEIVHKAKFNYRMYGYTVVKE